MADTYLEMIDWRIDGGVMGAFAGFCGHMENAIHALPRLDNWLKKAAASDAADAAECVHIYICDCHIV